MTQGRYKKLRKNASLKSVAEESIRTARRAWKNYREFSESINRAAKAGDPIRPDTRERQEMLAEYATEASQISGHLSRLAGIKKEGGDAV